MGNEVSVEITIEERAALKALAKLTSAVDDTVKKTEKSVNRMDLAFASFAGNVAASAVSKAVNAIRDSFSGAVEASKELEVIQTQFKTILGSTQAAQKQLEDLQQFAATTPFQLPGLSLATRQLLSFGVEQEKIIPTLRQLGDLAAGTGSQIDELTIPFGRLVSTQKLTLVELDKFADRGINLYGKLSEQTGISLKTIRDDISKGKVPFSEFEKALKDLTSQGGIFYGATQAQSETLQGVLSTLEDNFFNLQGAIGDTFKPVLIEGAKQMTTIVQELVSVFKNNGPAVVSVAKSLTETFITTPAQFWVDFFGKSTASSNIGAIKQEMEGLEQTISTITERINSNKDSTIYNSFFGKKSDDLEALDAAIVRLNKLREMKAEFDKKNEASAIKEVVKQEKVENPLDDPRVQKEMAVQAEIDAIRQQAKLAEQESKLLEKEAANLATESDLEALREIEAKKLEVKFEAEQAKANLIQNASEREMALNKINAQKSLEFEQLNSKQRIDIIKKEAELEKAVRAGNFKAAQNFMAAGQMLAKEGSAEAKALAIGQAMMNTYSGATAAIAPPPLGLGPVAGIPLMASTVALGLAQVAKISGAFAQGGFVGGMNGASIGGDNVLATVRTGEQILNASDQREVLTGLKSGAFSNGSDKLDQLISVLSSQPVIVEVDGIEVARAVRNAKEAGFVA